MTLKEYIEWLQSWPEDMHKAYVSDIITFDTKATDLTMLNYHPLVAHVEQIKYDEHQQDLFEVKHENIDNDNTHNHPGSMQSSDNNRPGSK